MPVYYQTHTVVLNKAPIKKTCIGLLWANIFHFIEAYYLFSRSLHGKIQKSSPG